MHHITRKTIEFNIKGLNALIKHYRTQNHKKSKENLEYCKREKGRLENQLK